MHGSTSMYAELRCKSGFSFLRGASHPQELVERAAGLGLAALAITDRNGVYGAPKAHQAAKGHKTLKLIVGSEVVFEDSKRHPEIVLLARNRAGYGLLCRLLTEAHRDKPKGEGALSWQTFLDMAGAEAGAAGCGGLFALVEPSREEGYEVLKQLFGNRLYLMTSRHRDGDDGRRDLRVRELQARWELPVVATNDVHLHEVSRGRLQDVMTAARHNTTLQELGLRGFSNRERHLKSPGQMRDLFHDWPEAIENTLRIAEACTFSMDELRYRYPSEWIPAGETAQSYLRKLVEAGLPRRYPEGEPADVRQVLEHELKLIEELGYADYFLTIWEVVQYARSKNILCQGRGSAANSVVCYLLEVTAIDPVRMKLLFERFLSKEREEPPDIDVDFEHDRREEVIQYVYERYGRDRAAMVCTYVTYRTKGSLRESRKAFGFKDGEEIPETRMQGLVQGVADELHGFPRHLSIHSGGFTLSADPITEIVPVEPATMENRTVIQWDKDDLEGLGLLKVDFLSLGMLTAIHKTLDMIGDPKLQFHTIPPDDPETYEMIRNADTVGTFQIESRAQMNMLGRLQPRNFYDLVVEVAIVRPGPIVGGMVHPYLRRRRGEEQPDLPSPELHAILEPILGRTLGVPIFQEQVMKMAVVLAGFTPGEADQLRRAMGTWRGTGSIERLGERFKAGLLERGLPMDFVNRVFEQIKGFSEYGFPESHAASFALIAYVSSYLKRHYPAQFTCALINAQPMGFYPVHSLIDDAKRHGVKILPVDVTCSQWDCTLESSTDENNPPALRLGLRLVRSLGEERGKALLKAREDKPFQGIRDFANRVPLPLDRHLVLARADALKAFGSDPRHTTWQVLEHQLLVRGDLHADGAKQLSLFSLMSGDSERERSGLFNTLKPLEAIQADYDTTGSSARAHPMTALRWRFKKIPRNTSREVKEGQTGDWVQGAGLVLIRQRPPTAKGTVFATLEDEHGFLDLVFHAAVYERTREVFMRHSFLMVSGILQRDLKTVSILVKRVQAIWEDPEERHDTEKRIDTRTYFHG